VSHRTTPATRAGRRPRVRGMWPVACSRVGTRAAPAPACGPSGWMRVPSPVSGRGSQPARVRGMEHRAAPASVCEGRRHDGVVTVTCGAAEDRRSVHARFTGVVRSAVEKLYPRPPERDAVLCMPCRATRSLPQKKKKKQSPGSGAWKRVGNHQQKNQFQNNDVHFAHQSSPTRSTGDLARSTHALATRYYSRFEASLTWSSSPAGPGAANAVRMIVEHHTTDSGHLTRTSPVASRCTGGLEPRLQRDRKMIARELNFHGNSPPSTRTHTSRTCERETIARRTAERKFSSLTATECYFVITQHA
jgi:hypothetical protein